MRVVSTSIRLASAFLHPRASLGGIPLLLQGKNCYRCEKQAITVMRYAIFSEVKIKNRSSVTVIDVIDPSGNSFLSVVSLERTFILSSVQPISCYSEPVQRCPKISLSWKRRRRMIAVAFRLKPTDFITSALASVLTCF